MERFENLDPKKQQKILDSALMEFAENGYGKASTNRIVKQAGIGKGMLFYYFKNKKDLYEYLIEYSLNFIITEYLSLVDINETDFIKRLKGAAQLKMKAQVENEHVFNFMGTVMLTKDLELPPHLQKRYEELQMQGYALLYGGIDKTLFRKGLDVDKAFNLIRWGVDGYQQDLLQRLQGQKMSDLDFEPYWDEFYEYLDILKKSFYTN
ncbi:TetR family transcriptional regulator [Planococcus antarcticus DSM 14505]|uniref:TetR family transcriptional regulator n=1 Tax=Planococcus antarcticus DSM 14505 TaxID=1185653 RepID=A0A1C7DCD0_9BACL|nr:TetR/AcrR family transcriptional regulator [Planococcus antarcticus]ANU09136.1 TetR family transcriptional regulator [Planococcus antarcticus DSM 14505]EIM08522.1 TetR family transcriptional regulator [Planococcus antarcticus DSM 14505]